MPREIAPLKTNLIRYERTLQGTYLQKNNTTGYNGVYRKANGTYRTYIQVNYKLIYLGTFSNIEDAIKARDIANSQYLPILKKRTQMEISEILKGMRSEINEQIYKSKQADDLVKGITDLFGHCQTKEDVVQVENKIKCLTKQLADKRKIDSSNLRDPLLTDFLNYSI